MIQEITPHSFANEYRVQTPEPEANVIDSGENAPLFINVDVSERMTALPLVGTTPSDQFAAVPRSPSAGPMYHAGLMAVQVTTIDLPSAPIALVNDDATSHVTFARSLSASSSSNVTTV